MPLKTRHARTIFLAIVATMTFVGAAIMVFDVEPGLMLRYFLASVFGLMLIVAAAALAVAAVKLVRRWLS